MEVTVNLNDGTSQTFLPHDPYGGSPSFLGFVSNVPIASLSIDADDNTGFGFAWSTVDNLYVGNLIPAPASIALLGFAGLLRRR